MTEFMCVVFHILFVSVWFASSFVAQAQDGRDPNQEQAKEAFEGDLNKEPSEKDPSSYSHLPLKEREEIFQILKMQKEQLDPLDHIVRPWAPLPYETYSGEGKYLHVLEGDVLSFTSRQYIERFLRWNQLMGQLIQHDMQPFLDPVDHKIIEMRLSQLFQPSNGHGYTYTNHDWVTEDAQKLIQNRTVFDNLNAPIRLLHFDFDMEGLRLPKLVGEQVQRSIEKALSQHRQWMDFKIKNALQTETHLSSMVYEIPNKTVLNELEADLKKKFSQIKISQNSPAQNNVIRQVVQMGLIFETLGLAFLQADNLALKEKILDLTVEKIVKIDGLFTPDMGEPNVALLKIKILPLLGVFPTNRNAIKRAYEILGMGDMLEALGKVHYKHTDDAFRKNNLNRSWTKSTASTELITASMGVVAKWMILQNYQKAKSPEALWIDQQTFAKLLVKPDNLSKRLPYQVEWAEAPIIYDMPSAMRVLQQTTDCKKCMDLWKAPEHLKNNFPSDPTRNKLAEKFPHLFQHPDRIFFSNIPLYGDLFAPVHNTQSTLHAQKTETISKAQKTRGPSKQSVSHPEEKLVNSEQEQKVLESMATMAEAMEKHGLAFLLATSLVDKEASVENLAKDILPHLDFAKNPPSLAQVKVALLPYIGVLPIKRTVLLAFFKSIGAENTYSTVQKLYHSHVDQAMAKKAPTRGWPANTTKSHHITSAMALLPKWLLMQWYQEAGRPEAQWVNKQTYQSILIQTKYQHEKVPVELQWTSVPKIQNMEDAKQLFGTTTECLNCISLFTILKHIQNLSFNDALGAEKIIRYFPWLQNKPSTLWLSNMTEENLFIDAMASYKDPQIQTDPQPAQQRPNIFQRTLSWMKKAVGADKQEQPKSKTSEMPTKTAPIELEHLDWLQRLQTWNKLTLDRLQGGLSENTAFDQKLMNLFPEFSTEAQDQLKKQYIQPRKTFSLTAQEAHTAVSQFIKDFDIKIVQTSNLETEKQIIATLEDIERTHTKAENLKGPRMIGPMSLSLRIAEILKDTRLGEWVLDKTLNISRPSFPPDFPTDKVKPDRPLHVKNGEQPNAPKNLENPIPEVDKEAQAVVPQNKWTERTHRYIDYTTDIENRLDRVKIYTDMDQVHQNIDALTTDQRDQLDQAHKKILQRIRQSSTPFDANHLLRTSFLTQAVLQKESIQWIRFLCDLGFSLQDQNARGQTAVRSMIQLSAHPASKTLSTSPWAIEEVQKILLDYPVRFYHRVARRVDQKDNPNKVIYSEFLFTEIYIRKSFSDQFIIEMYKRGLVTSEQIFIQYKNDIVRKKQKRSLAFIEGLQNAGLSLTEPFGHRKETILALMAYNEHKLKQTANDRRILAAIQEEYDQAWKKEMGLLTNTINQSKVSKNAQHEKNSSHKVLLNVLQQSEIDKVESSPVKTLFNDISLHGISEINSTWQKAIVHAYIQAQTSNYEKIMDYAYIESGLDKYRVQKPALMTTIEWQSKGGQTYNLRNMHNFERYFSTSIDGCCNSNNHLMEEKDARFEYFVFVADDGKIHGKITLVHGYSDPGMSQPAILVYRMQNMDPSIVRDCLDVMSQYAEFKGKNLLLASMGPMEDAFVSDNQKVQQTYRAVEQAQWKEDFSNMRFFTLEQSPGNEALLWTDQTSLLYETSAEPKKASIKQFLLEPVKLETRHIKYIQNLLVEYGRKKSVLPYFNLSRILTFYNVEHTFDPKMYEQFYTDFLNSDHTNRTQLLRALYYHPLAVEFLPDFSNRLLKVHQAQALLPKLNARIDKNKDKLSSNVYRNHDHYEAFIDFIYSTQMLMLMEGSENSAEVVEFQFRKYLQPFIRDLFEKDLTNTPKLKVLIEKQKNKQTPLYKIALSGNQAETMSARDNSQTPRAIILQTNIDGVFLSKHGMEALLSLPTVDQKESTFFYDTDQIIRLEDNKAKGIARLVLNGEPHEIELDVKSIQAIEESELFITSHLMVNGQLASDVDFEKVAHDRAWLAQAKAFIRDFEKGTENTIGPIAVEYQRIKNELKAMAKQHGVRWTQAVQEKFWLTLYFANQQGNAHEVTKTILLEKLAAYWEVQLGLTSKDGRLAAYFKQMQQADVFSGPFTPKPLSDSRYQVVKKSAEKIKNVVVQGAQHRTTGFLEEFAPGTQAYQNRTDQLTQNLNSVQHEVAQSFGMQDGRLHIRRLRNPKTFEKVVSYFKQADWQMSPSDRQALVNYVEMQKKLTARSANMAYTQEAISLLNELVEQLYQDQTGEKFEQAYQKALKQQKTQRLNQEWYVQHFRGMPRESAKFMGALLINTTLHAIIHPTGDLLEDLVHLGANTPSHVFGLMTFSMGAGVGTELSKLISEPVWGKTLERLQHQLNQSVLKGSAYRLASAQVGLRTYLRGQIGFIVGSLVNGFIHDDYASEGFWERQTLSISSFMMASAAVRVGISVPVHFLEAFRVLRAGSAWASIHPAGFISQMLLLSADLYLASYVQPWLEKSIMQAKLEPALAEPYQAYMQVLSGQKQTAYGCNQPTQAGVLECLTAKLTKGIRDHWLKLNMYEIHQIEQQHLAEFQAWEQDQDQASIVYSASLTHEKMKDALAMNPALGLAGAKKLYPTQHKLAEKTDYAQMKKLDALTRVVLPQKHAHDAKLGYQTYIHELSELTQKYQKDMRVMYNELYQELSEGRVAMVRHQHIQAAQQTYEARAEQCNRIASVDQYLPCTSNALNLYNEKLQQILFGIEGAWTKEQRRVLHTKKDITTAQKLFLQGVPTMGLEALPAMTFANVIKPSDFLDLLFQMAQSMAKNSSNDVAIQNAVKSTVITLLSMHNELINDVQGHVYYSSENNPYLFQMPHMRVQLVDTFVPKGFEFDKGHLDVEGFMRWHATSARKYTMILPDEYQQQNLQLYALGYAVVDHMLEQGILRFDLPRGSQKMQEIRAALQDALLITLGVQDVPLTALFKSASMIKDEHMIVLGQVAERMKQRQTQGAPMLSQQPCAGAVGQKEIDAEMLCADSGSVQIQFLFQPDTESKQNSQDLHGQWATHYQTPMGVPISFPMGTSYIHQETLEALIP